MSWAKGTSASNTSGFSSVTFIQTTAGQTLNIGDIICLAITYGTTADAPTVCVIDDPAGKCGTFTQSPSIHDNGQQETNLVAFAKITTAGVATPRLRWNPTPGTTIATLAAMVVDPFTGSDAASAADGTGNGILDGPAGAGTDNLSSGTWATTTDGDLIYGCTTETTAGNDTMTHGTGFTDGAASSLVVVRSEWKTQTTHSATTTATFNSTIGGRFITAAMAITPAVVGVGAPFPPDYQRMRALLNF